MIKSLKEWKQDLAKIGSVNLEEEYMVDLRTGEKSGTIRLYDVDRDFFWIYELAEAGKYKLVYQASIF